MAFWISLFSNFRTLSFSCLLSKFSSTSARPIKNCSWKASNYSFVRDTWLLPASTNYYLSGTLQWGVWPTIHRNPLHFCQPCCFFSVWLSALMRSRLQSMAVGGSMVSGETQDNEWIIKGSPVERKEFWFLCHHPHNLHSISLPLHPQAFLPVMIPGCHMQMKDTAVGLMLINTVQIFI